VQPQGGVPGHCVGIDGDWWHEPGTCAGAPNNCAGCCARGLDWIIVGGESGPGARPFDVEWARSTVRQCRAADVPVFVKQMGGYVCDRNDRLALDNPPLDKTWWPEPKCSWDDGPRGNIERDLRGYRDDYQGAPVRIKLQDRKGGDPSEWPEDLRVREFPEARA
jgi:hypothetical protein